MRSWLRASCEDPYGIFGAKQEPAVSCGEATVNQPERWTSAHRRLLVSCGNWTFGREMRIIPIHCPTRPTRLGVGYNIRRAEERYRSPNRLVPVCVCTGQREFLRCDLRVG